MNRLDQVGRIVLKAQSFAYFILAIYLFSNLHLAWWLYVVFFLAPDLSFIGYAASPKAGVISYNIAHHFGTVAVLYGAGLYLHSIWLLFAATIVLGHLAFDRILGFGLRNLEEF